MLEKYKDHFTSFSFIIPCHAQVFSSTVTTSILASFSLHLQKKCVYIYITAQATFYSMAVGCATAAIVSLQEHFNPTEMKGGKGFGES